MGKPARRHSWQAWSVGFGLGAQGSQGRGQREEGCTQPGLQPERTAWGWCQGPAKVLTRTLPESGRQDPASLDYGVP